MKKEKVTSLKYEEDFKFFRCSCASEGMLVTECVEDFGSTDGVKHQEFYFSMFQYYNAGKPNMKKRLRYVWKHILKGQYWNDEIIMERDKVKKLIQYLQEKIDKYDEYEK